jgi:hypothetical protein
LCGIRPEEGARIALLRDVFLWQAALEARDYTGHTASELFLASEEETLRLVADALESAGSLHYPAFFPAKSTKTAQESQGQGQEQVQEQPKFPGVVGGDENGVPEGMLYFDSLRAQLAVARETAARAAILGAGALGQKMPEPPTTAAAGGGSGDRGTGRRRRRRRQSAGTPPSSSSSAGKIESSEL